jgi:hypothetical protein
MMLQKARAARAERSDCSVADLDLEWLARVGACMLQVVVLR